MNPIFSCFQEYPDYYEVIKRPIDLERISQKLRSNGYESLEELSQDLMLMCDNACKYNEPDSQIYKVCIQLRNMSNWSYIFTSVFIM